MSRGDKQHYHVRLGSIGCLPDSDHICWRRRDAEELAADIARDLRAGGRRVQGSARAGYYDIAPITYLEIEPCAQEGCLEEPWL